MRPHYLWPRRRRAHAFHTHGPPSDELGHRSYPGCSPVAPRLFTATWLLRAQSGRRSSLRPEPLSYVWRPAMTPIRIDRCLQSTYFFFKDEYPAVSAHSVVALVGRDSAAVVSHRHAGFGGPGELTGALSSPTSRLRASLWLSVVSDRHRPFRRTPLPPCGDRCAPKNAADFRPPRSLSRAHVNGTRSSPTRSAFPPSVPPHPVHDWPWLCRLLGRRRTASAVFQPTLGRDPCASSPELPPGGNPSLTSPFPTPSGRSLTSRSAGPGGTSRSQGSHRNEVPFTDSSRHSSSSTRFPCGWESTVSPTRPRLRSSPCEGSLHRVPSTAS
jgi:hypothetical protein